MPWQSVRILVDSKQAELLSDALMEVGALSVSLEDADVGTEDETPLFGEPDYPTAELWQHSIAVVLLEEHADIAATLAAAAKLARMPVPTHYEIETIAEQDWVRLTQSQFDPIPISPRLWIVPTWHAAPDAAAINLKLDPGLAFGTGSHPTTRLCLRWLDENIHGGETLLDYGCGSGILAIGAATFGATDIDAVDIDAAAVQATQANAQANDAVLNAGLPDRARGLYQTVLANILASPLKVLAPLLCAHVAAGGSLVLAGILERQTDELKQAYAPYAQLEIADTQDGWVLMTARL